MTTLGERLIASRRRRRITQQQLASIAGISVELVRSVEQGKRMSVRLDTLHRLAQALDVQAWELMGRQPGLAVGGESREVLDLRRAVHGHGEHPTEPRDVEALRGELAELWRLYWTGRNAPLARELPTCLAEARAAVRSTGSPLAYAVLAETYQVTAALLAHLTYEDLAHVALLRATDAATAADDPLLVAAQQATVTWVLARQGLWSEAENLAVTSAAVIEPTLSKASPDQLAVWGELLRYGVTALARSGRATEAVEMQSMVRAAASAMANRRPSMTGVITFGPTIAGMSAVGIAVSTDEPRKALDLASRVTDISAAPLIVQGRYLLNVAYAQMADWRSEEAAETLRRVDALGPEMLEHQSIARVIVEELLPRRRTARMPGLVEIAERMGLPVHSR